jgi:hypothetical protein
MAEVLSICTKEKQRAMVHFLRAEGTKGVEIHRRLSPQYGDNVLPQRSVYEWTVVLNHNRSSVTGAENSITKQE